MTTQDGDGQPGDQVPLAAHVYFRWWWWWIPHGGTREGGERWRETGADQVWSLTQFFKFAFHKQVKPGFTNYQP